MFFVRGALLLLLDVDLLDDIFLYILSRRRLERFLATLMLRFLLLNRRADRWLASRIERSHCHTAIERIFATWWKL